MQYLKKRYKTFILNLVDLASSIIEFKFLNASYLLRQAEVKLRFPYITIILMTLKVGIQVGVVYFLLENLSLQYGVLGFINKEYLFQFYLVLKILRYVYYLVGIMDSLISDKSFIINHLNKRRNNIEDELADIEMARERVLLWGDQYISKQRSKDA